MTLVLKCVRAKCNLSPHYLKILDLVQYILHISHSIYPRPKTINALQFQKL